MPGPTPRQMVKKAGVQFCDLSITSQLAANKVLYSEWRASVCTEESTRVSLYLNTEWLRISFFSPLFVNVQWPCENARWRGLTYTFAKNKRSKGKLTDIDLWRIPGWTVDATWKVKEVFRSTFQSMIAGTKIDQPGYSPLDDANPRATLNQILANMKKNSRIGTIGLKDLTGLQVGMSVSLAQAITQVTPEGGIEIPRRAYLELQVKLQGNARSVADGTVRADDVTIKSKDIFLTQGGKRLVRLKTVVVYRGGLVRVKEHQGLGDLGTAEGVESIVRLLGVLTVAVSESKGHSAGAALHAGRSISRGYANPTLVKGVTRSMLEDALTKALKTVYSQNYKAIQAKLPRGIKLDDIFGINPRLAGAK